MFVVAVFAAGIAAFGPIYLNSTDQTILQATLRSAIPANDGLTLETSLEHYVPKRIAAAVAAIPRPGGEPWYGRPIVTELAPFVTRVGPQPYVGSLVARTGVCHHVQIVAGTCAYGRDTVILSTRTAHLLHLSLGHVIRVHVAGGRAPALRIVGLYAAGNPAAPYWWGQNFFGYGNGSPTRPRLDAGFVSPATMAQTVPRRNLSSFAQVPFADSYRVSVPGRSSLGRASSGSGSPAGVGAWAHRGR